jgi:hypothetical protein
MDAEKYEREQLRYDDEIPTPEEEAPPPDDETDEMKKAVAKHRVPADEDVPDDCFNRNLL